VDDARGVRVPYPLKGVGTLQLTDEALLVEKYGVTGAQYVDFAVLRGDPGAGLPGVPGIGETARAGPGPSTASAGHQRPWRDLTLSPKVQPSEPSQLIDHVMSPFSAPPKAFQDWLTRLGVM